MGRTQSPVAVTPGVGSIPTFGTIHLLVHNQFAAHALLILQG